METLYDLLGVRREASDVELRAAYRRAAMRWHPDRNVGAPGLTEDHFIARFIAVTQAFDVLSDPLARFEYDRALGPARRSWRPFRSTRVAVGVALAALLAPLWWVAFGDQADHDARLASLRRHVSAQSVPTRVNPVDSKRADVGAESARQARDEALNELQARAPARDAAPAASGVAGGNGEPRGAHRAAAALPARPAKASADATTPTPAQGRTLETAARKPRATVSGAPVHSLGTGAPMAFASAPAYEPEDVGTLRVEELHKLYSTGRM
jgi:curved DNA-binding protein CbpA